ncbi:MAG: hypothetical protein ACTHK7_01775 [Aureliella sp.]
MAARDRNLFAWQAYVITTSIISLGLLIGVFLLWRSYADLSKRNAEMASQMKTVQDENSKWTMRVNRLKSMLGYGTYTAEEINYMRDSLKDDPELGEIEKNYVTDMAVFDPNVEKKDYPQFPIFLLETIRERNKQIDSARQVEQKLTREKAEITQREMAAREQAVKEKEEAVTELRQANEQHKQQIAKLNAEKDQIQAQVTKFKQDLEAKNGQLQAQVNQLAAENKKQAETIDTQKERIKLLLKDDFEEPAGEVINVAQGSRLVWINVGSDDGLREGVSFAVLDESTQNVADAKIKAEMVVEKVIEPHMAMARVTSPNYTDPVLPGDLVYSPAWRKGRTVGFALVGLMDINGDGRDDRDMIKSIIERSGGKVDAEMLPNKTVQGPGMDVNTYAVVIGTDVAVGENATKEQQDKAAAYAKFIGEAKSYGIPQMSMNRLMGFLKSKNDTRTIPLGDKTRASDFEPRSNGLTPESQGTVSDLFRQRRPARP